MHHPTTVAAHQLSGLRWDTPPVIALARFLTRIRLRRGRVRSLWGTTPILTLPLLARCDRLLGFRSHSLVFVTYYISRAFDFNLRFIDRIALSRYVRPRFPRAYSQLRRAV